MSAKKHKYVIASASEAIAITLAPSGRFTAFFRWERHSISPFVYPIVRQGLKTPAGGAGLTWLLTPMGEAQAEGVPCPYMAIECTS